MATTKMSDMFNHSNTIHKHDRQNYDSIIALSSIIHCVIKILRNCKKLFLKTIFKIHVLHLI